MIALNLVEYPIAGNFSEAFYLASSVVIAKIRTHQLNSLYALSIYVTKFEYQYTK